MHIFGRTNKQLSGARSSQVATGKLKQSVGLTSRRLTSLQINLLYPNDNARDQS